MRAPDPFAEFAGWDDVDSIKASVERALARGAGVSVDTLRTALRRVIYDGDYGPVSDADWRRIDGTRMTMSRARETIRAAQDAEIPTVRLDHPDAGYTCAGSETCGHEDHDLYADGDAMFHHDVVEIPREALLEWYFGALRPIYGRIDI